MSWGRQGRVALAPAAVTLVVCVAACGSSASSSVSSTVKSYFAALAAGDGHAACAQLTSGATAEVARLAHQAPQFGGTSCADVIAKVSTLLNRAQRRELRSVRVIDVHIQGGTATAAAEAGGRTSRTYQLSKRGQRWLLSGGFLP